VDRARAEVVRAHGAARGRGILVIASRPIIAVCLAAAVVAGGSAPAREPGPLERGRESYRRGDYAEAAELLRQAVRLDPGSLSAWRDLANALEKLGRDREALEVWLNLLAVEPDRVEWLNAAGRLESRLQRFTEAATHLGRSLQLRSAQPAIRLSYGEALEALERWDAAAEQYRTALADASVQDAARSRLVRLLDRRGDLDTAWALLSDALASDPAFAQKNGVLLARVQAGRGDALYERGEYPSAASRYQEALRYDPSQARVWASLGWSYQRQGELDRAVESWRRAASLAPTASLYRAMADARIQMGRLEDAEKLLLEAIGLDPADTGALTRLVDLGIRLDEPELVRTAWKGLAASPSLDADTTARATRMFVDGQRIDLGIELFEEAAESQPRLPGLDRGLARLYGVRVVEAYREGRWNDAIETGEKALGLDPENASLLRDVGWAYWRAGRWEECESAWKRLAAADPGGAMPYDLLGQLYLQQHRFADAAAALERGLSIDPTQRNTRLRLVRALAGEERFPEALEVARSIAADEPEDLAVQRRYAELLTRVQDHAEAAAQWRRVLDLDPSRRDAEERWILETYQSGNADEAIRLARGVAARDDAPERVIELLAKDAFFQGDFEHAAAWYSSLTDRFPERARYWVEKARILDQMGRYEDRLATLNAGLTHHPRLLELELDRADALLAAGRWERAYEEYLRLVRDHPDNRTAFRGLFHSALVAGRSRQALDLIAGNHPTFLSDLEVELWEAAALAASGKTGRAEQQLRQSTGFDASRSVPILLYHGVSEHPRTLETRLDRFEEHMEVLAHEGYCPITLTELARVLDGVMPMPRRPVLVTFDDARTDSFRLADPVLERLGFKSTMFAPTARIGAADLLHASWTSMRTFAASGRWDIQAHGHLAHGEVVIDATGRTGRFLTNRAWIEDEQRLETTDEFAARLDRDYHACRDELVSRIPGAKVLGYAFPYSELGQLVDGNEPRALAINDEIFRRYYRFGLVENLQGSNLVRVGDRDTALLWRFEPPSSFTGDDLLRHLARWDPRNAMRLEMGRILAWQGLTGEAEAELRHLGDVEPRLRPQVEMTLAEVDVGANRTRAAEKHVDAAVTAGGRPPSDDSYLTREIEWGNRDRLGANLDYFDDSNGRSTSRAVVQSWHVFREPVDLGLSAGWVRFDERRQPSLSGPELSVETRWITTPRLDVTAWSRFRGLEGVDDRVHGGAAASYRRDRHEARVDVAYVDLATASSLRAGISAMQWAGGYTWRSNLWRAFANIAVRNADDGNRRDDVRGGFTRFWPGRARWEGGLVLESSSSRFMSNLYYTPLGLFDVKLRGAFQESWRTGSSFAIEASLGEAWDDVVGRRFVASAHTRWTHAWTSRLRSGIEIDYYDSPGYRSFGATMWMGWIP
jgi:tetratricopeptide (TPR) repeat protein/peptidoglycan/xylan/chitin deacetylase (PgdA/CDA1 family)